MKNDFFYHYEIIRIEAQPFFFKDQKTLILTLTNVSNEKAQLQLLSLHAKSLSVFIDERKRQIECNQENKVSNEDQLLMTLGNSILLLNGMY